MTSEGLSVEREPDRLNLNTSSGNESLELISLEKKYVNNYSPLDYNKTYGDLNIVILEDESGVNNSKFSRHAKKENEALELTFEKKKCMYLCIYIYRRWMI